MASLNSNKAAAQTKEGRKLSLALSGKEPTYLGTSAENLDGKATRSTEIECPGSVKCPRRLHIEVVVPQALIDLVYLFLAFLPEANYGSWQDT